MESVAGCSENRNDVLSRSYIQGVERVAQRSKDDAGFSFNLPKEVIVEREKAWDNFFDKFASEVPGEIELNIDTMEPATNEDDEEDEDEEESQDREYYSKCRAPMRKLPALIQYWIDTGNPPYQLIGEEDHSETGSSLSEGEHSRSGRSAILREYSDDPKFHENSPYSSVDTAAYILANVNVTRKAETMAIVEGARRPEETSFLEAVEPTRSIDAVARTANGAALPLENYRTVSSTTRAPLNNSMSSQRSSVRLSEVLPALQKFEELLEKSNVTRSSRSALSKVRHKRRPIVVIEKLTYPENNSAAVNALARQSIANSVESSLNAFGKPTNRRKLYTGRNSPIDLIAMRSSTDSAATTGQNLSHPALEPIVDTKDRVGNLVNRARARRKRASQRRSAALAATTTQRQNETRKINEPVQDDSNNNNNNNSNNNNSNDNNHQSTRKNDENNEIKMGHERYTDFFESLGLTPSKTIIGRDENNDEETGPKARNKRIKRARKVEKKYRVGTVKRRETRQSRKKEIRDKPRRDDLGEKILSVRIARLSEDILARYERSRCRVNAASLSNDSFDKKETASIELLTTMTHDSDSSTILICSCNPANSADRSSGSDGSIFAKKSISRRINESSCANGAASRRRKNVASSNDEIAKSSENIGESCNDRNLIVRLEKLPSDERSRIAGTAYDLKKSESSLAERSRDSRMKFRKIPSTTPPSLKINDLSDARANETTGCATIGSRVYDDSGNRDASRIARAKSEGDSIISLFDEVDDLVRFAVGKDSARIRENNGKRKNGTRHEFMKKTTSDEGEKANEMEKIQRPLTRSRGALRIVESSDDDDDDDEEEEVRVKISRQEISKRREKKFLTNEPAERENPRRIIDELAKGTERLDEATNEMKNRHDESIVRSANNGVSIESTRINGLGGSLRKNVFSREANNEKNVFHRSSVDASDTGNVESHSRLVWKSDRGKRRRIMNRTNDESSRAIDLPRFRTRLNSSSGSDIEQSKFMDFDEKKLTKKPIVRRKLPVGSLKKFIDSENEKNQRGTNSSEKIFARVNEFIDHVRSDVGSSGPVASSSLTSGDSRKKMNDRHSRGSRNEETPAGPVERKNHRRPRILASSMEYESDEADEQRSRNNSSRIARRAENYSTYEKIFKPSADKIIASEREKNDRRDEARDFSNDFFSHTFDDTFEDVELIFDEDSRVTRTSGMMKNFRLDSLVIGKKISPTRQSTLRFRTRLVNDSDDDL